MKKFLFHGVSLLCGLLFGAGMVISQMVNPAKVIGFLDVTGHWDISLMFVMLGALIVFTPVFWLIINRRNRPLLAGTFSFSTLKKINCRLVAGSVVFGVGWGLSGICPGPALARMSFMEVNTWVFFASMLLGLAGTQYFVQKVNNRKEQLKLSLMEK
ncbi:YeeE/YedE family protein [Vibrio salinus]|uniref:YeeE/YedE family protein n=1 Tax=Vibrio salinus TaxID=2899784 RepID=UPI001E3B1E63|nr:YeeE/YedE family protein [Vibrio salinus]MCE0495387.1 YeeE/YedE family protein [Vibrio salinus]